MTDVEDSAEMAPQRGVRFGDRDAGKLRNSRRCGAGIEMIFEVVDNFVRRFEKAIGFRFERQPDGAAASLFEFDQVRYNAQDMFGEFGDHFGSGDARLESERWTLDRRSCVFRRDIRQDLRDIDRILRTFFSTPVGFIDLFLYGSSFEWAIRKRIHRV